MLVFSSRQLALVANYRRAPDLRVGEDVKLVAAAGGELGHHRAIRSRLEPVQGIGIDRVLLTGPQYDFVPGGISLLTPGGRAAGRRGGWLAFDVQINKALAAAESLFF